MQTQIIIKHFSVEKIINIFKSVNSTNNFQVICKFCINEEEYFLVEKLCKTIHCKIDKNLKERPLSKHKYYDIALSIPSAQISDVVEFIKNNEINAELTCQSLKIVMNDNDGDFVLLNTTDSNYKTLKNIITPFTK